MVFSVFEHLRMLSYFRSMVDTTLLSPKPELSKEGQPCKSSDLHVRVVWPLPSCEAQY